VPTGNRLADEKNASRMFTMIPLLSFDLQYDVTALDDDDIYRRRQIDRTGGTCTEDLTAVVTAWCKIVIVAFRTVESIVLSGKRPVDQRSLAVRTLKALFMPVQFFVRQILYTYI
jgi:hypothetical protein